MAGRCFPSRRDEMRGNQCAINSPRFTATSSRGLFHCSPPLARLKHLLYQPVRFYFGLPDGYSPLAKNYFNLLPSSLCPSSPPPPPSHLNVVFEPDRGWIYSPFFATFFRPKRAVIYGDASINVAARRFEY